VDLERGDARGPDRDFAGLTKQGLSLVELREHASDARVLGRLADALAACVAGARNVLLKESRTADRDAERALLNLCKRA
jgi:hypothetical protein